MAGTPNADLQALLDDFAKEVGGRCRAIQPEASVKDSASCCAGRATDWDHGLAHLV